jgi:hypothetical protein
VKTVSPLGGCPSRGKTAKKRRYAVPQPIIRKIFRKPFFLIIFGSLFLSNPAFAITLKLLWEASNPVPEGYEVYERIKGETYNYNNPICRGIDTYCTKKIDENNVNENADKGDVTHYFVVRAFIGNQFSADSNEVSFNPSIIYQDDANGGIMRGEVSVVWPSDDQGVDLAPVLIISSKSKRLPPTIIWRISTKEDMSPIVLSVPTTDHNLSFQVPELVLDTDTQYFWQAKIYDENGQLIDRTEVAPFITILYSQSDDKDSDGIIDHQKLKETSDLDQDGVSDDLQTDFFCLKTSKGNAKIGVKSLSPNAAIVAVKTVDDINYNHSLNKPDIMTYGLFSFKLFLNNDAGKADVGVYFSEPINAKSDCYKYDPKEGWTMMDGTMFSADRKSITFSIVDGGFGDEDGVKNGIIVDPLGIGRMPSSQNFAADSSNSTNGNGCYINTLVSLEPTNKIRSFNRLDLLMGWFIIGLAGLFTTDKK